jgi:hypothetical protein
MIFERIVFDRPLQLQGVDAATGEAVKMPTSSVPTPQFETVGIKRHLPPQQPPLL